MYLPVSPMYTLPHSQGILHTTPSCFRGSTGFLGRTKCDLSVVSDFKTDRMPRCCRQRLSGEVTIVKQTIKLNPLYTLSTMINILHDNHLFASRSFPFPVINLDLPSALLNVNKSRSISNHRDLLLGR